MFSSHRPLQKTEGKPGAKDQSAEIAELQKKLAASEAKSRDFGKDKKVHLALAAFLSHYTYGSLCRNFEEAGKTAGHRIRPPRHRI